jgi:uncharacterized protein involved in outer membrane biogenesis
MVLNSILTYIAGLLVALLFAALVGPSLIDWNQFRAEIEAQASQATGRQVQITGNIDFRILPAPQMTLNRVRVGHAGQASALPTDPDFASFEAINAEVALAPLLSGDIKVTSVDIVRPRINLEVLPDGTPNWRGINIAERIRENGMFSLASISLDRARFEDATISYRNRSNGRSWTAEQASGEIVASSLLGPLRADVEAVFAGVPVAMRAGLGAFGGQKAFQVTLDIEAKEFPAQFLFSGVATEFSLNGRLDGNGRLRIGAAGGEADTAPLRVDAGMVVNARRADLRNLSVVADGSTLAGAAQLRWEGRPRFSLDLSAESFSLDPLLDMLVAPEGQASVNLLDNLLAMSIPQGMDGRVKLGAKTLLIRKIPLRDVAFEASLKDGAADIGRVAAAMGGATEVEFSGQASAAVQGMRFIGSGEVRSGNVAALAAWLSPEPDDGTVVRPAAPGRPFSARSRLDLRSGHYMLNGLEVAYARDLTRPGLQGKLSSESIDGRPFIRAELDLSEFDFDPLIALLPKEGDPFAWLAARDIALLLNADEMTIFGRAMKGVGAELSLRSGRLSVARFDVADLSGAALALTGDIDGVTAGTRHDVKGRFNGSIKAERFGGLLAIGGLDVPDVEGPVDLVVSGFSGEADDSDLRVDTMTLQGSLRGSRVDGVLKRRHGPAGGVDRLEITGTAANEQGRILLEQLGLSPRDDLSGAGTVSVQLNGDTGGTYDANFRVNIGGTTLTALGKVEKPFEAIRFNGRADIAASGVLHVLGGFGAPEGLARWVGRQAAGPGFVFSSNVIWDKKSLALSDLEAVAGSFRLLGEAVWTAGEGETLPKLTGKLEANGLDLTPLIGGDETAVWPGDALDWSALGALDANVDLKAGSLALGRLTASNVVTRISLSRGVLTASPFTGDLARGRLSLDARIEGGSGQPGIGLAIALENADLRQAMVPALGGSPGTGRLDLNAQLQAQGRSWLALVSSTSGKADAKLSGLRLSPLDLPGFGAGLAALSSIEAFPVLIDETLFMGETRADDLDLAFEMNDGVMRLANREMTLEGGTAVLDLVYDLPRLAADAAMTVRLAEPQGAPEFLIGATSRQGRMDVQTDTLALQNFAARRILQRSVDEAGAVVPRDLRDLMELPAAAQGGTSPAPLPLQRPQAN